MNLLADGAAWLEAQRHAHLTSTVTYKRGASSVELAATKGRTEFEQTDSYGIVTRIESRDFLILAADLILDAIETIPARGDTIEETQGSVTYTYQVTAPGDDPPWRYSDLERTTLRIHTKLVGQT